MNKRKTRFILFSSLMCLLAVCVLFIAEGKVMKVYAGEDYQAQWNEARIRMFDTLTNVSLSRDKQDWHKLCDPVDDAVRTVTVEFDEGSSTTGKCWFGNDPKGVFICSVDQESRNLILHQYVGTKQLVDIYSLALINGKNYAVCIQKLRSGPEFADNTTFIKSTALKSMVFIRCLYEYDEEDEIIQRLGGKMPGSAVCLLSPADADPDDEYPMYAINCLFAGKTADSKHEKLHSAVSIDIRGLELYGQDWSYMFYGCEDLLSFSGGEEWRFDEMYGSNFSHMFDGCSKLVNIDFYLYYFAEEDEDLDPEDRGGLDLSYMFNGCSNLLSINMSGEESGVFDSNLATLKAMFMGCEKLSNIGNADYGLFNFCSTEKLTDMSMMFKGCSSLEYINLGDGFDASGVSEKTDIFEGCTALGETDPWNPVLPTAEHDIIGVFYNLCGGGASGNPMYVTWDGEDITLVLHDPVRPGYIFKGWEGDGIEDIAIGEDKELTVTVTKEEIEQCEEFANTYYADELRRYNEELTRYNEDLERYNEELEESRRQAKENGEEFDEELYRKQHYSPKPPTIRARNTLFLVYAAIWEKDPDSVIYTGEGSTEDEENDDSAIASENIYIDSSCTQLVTGADAIVFVNGGKNKSSQINYKAGTYYITFKAEDGNFTETIEKNGTEKTKTYKGKVVVGVTSSADIPSLSKGKIVKDTTAENIAKASYKKNNGSIIVTAKKNSGTIYVWALLLEKKSSSEDYTVKSSGYVKMTVKMAPKKVGFAETEGSTTIVKTGEVKLGETKDIYVTGTSASGDVDDDVTYEVSLANGASSYATLTPIEGSKNGYRLTATALKNDKKVKVKINAICKENNKKGSYALTIQPAE